eukprot:3373304-Rhodomonas_salina.1
MTLHDPSVAQQRPRSRHNRRCAAPRAQHPRQPQNKRAPTSHKSDQPPRNKSMRNTGPGEGGG